MRYPAEQLTWARYTSIVQAFWVLVCIKRHPRGPKQVAEGVLESGEATQYKNLVHVRAMSLVCGVLLLTSSCAGLLGNN